MSKGGEIALILIGIAGLAATIFFLTRQSEDAGKAAGRWLTENVINPLRTNPFAVAGTQNRSDIQSGDLYHLDPNLPVTPGGFNLSNWTWQAKADPSIMIGLPANMTPKEFCTSSPGSPMCQPGGVLGDYATNENSQSWLLW